MADLPSRQTLDGIPSRVLKFLIAVGKYYGIRAALASKGYTQEQHDLAWSLLQKLAIFPPASGPIVDKTVRDAVVELDAWDEPNFAIIRAALERTDPELATFVFDNLEPKQGSEAVVSVSTMLDRLDALESAPARKATRKTDNAALEVLASHGYTKTERTRLRDLVKKATTIVELKPISDDEREKTLLALQRWYNVWIAVAHLVISRRDHKIQIGIAKRRKAKEDAVPPQEPIAPSPSPVTTAAKPQAG